MALPPKASGVYLLRVVTTGETYIGSSTNMRLRAQQHMSEVRTLRRNLWLYALLAEHGLETLEFEVVEECDPAVLYERELHWIAELKPVLNQYKNASREKVYTDVERAKKAERVRKLWAMPEYRERAVAARMGNTYAKKGRS